MNKRSIIKKYLYLSMLSGIIMGIIFPFFTLIFVNFKSRSIFALFFLSCILAGIIVGVISFLIGKTTLIKAVKELKKNFSNVRDGDLNSQCHIESNDELGEAAKGFNQLIANFASVVYEINNSTKIVHDFSTLLSQKLKAILSNTDSKESIVSIQKSIEFISSLSHKQLLLADECTSVLNIANEGIIDIKTKVSNTRENAKDIIDRIHLGKENLKDSHSMMDSITESSRNIEDLSNELRNNSQNIVQVLNLTLELLKQTQILALNAKIESSRANTDGKGFLVVAEEMVKLSNRTNTLVSQTHNLTELLLTGIDKLFSSTKESSENLELYREINNKSYENMDVMLSKFLDNMKHIEEIDESVGEQVKLIEKTQNNWHEIKESSHKIDYNAQEHSSITKYIKEDLEEVESSSAKLYEISSKLQENVKFFKL